MAERMPGAGPGSSSPPDAPVPSYLKTRPALDPSAPAPAPAPASAFDPARAPAYGAAPVPRPSPGLPGLPPAAFATGDALAFRSRLQPTLFGMPRAIAIIVGVSVFILVLGLLFLIFS
jgi:hypothetical protein